MGFASFSYTKPADLETHLSEINEELKDKTIMTLEPFETVNSKFISSGGNETSNDHFKYKKYVVSAQTTYKVSAISSENINTYLIYYFDSNLNFISRTLTLSPDTDGRIREYSDREITTPQNAVYIYMNVYVRNESSYKLKTANNTQDRADEIIDILNKSKVCKLGKGTFYINSIDMPDDCTIEGCGKSSKLILKADNSYAIRLGARCTVKDLWLDGGNNLVYKGEENLSIDSIVMAGNRHGILLLGDGTNYNWSGSVISNCEITNFEGGGITCDNTGYGPYSSLTVSNCWIRNCCVGINIAYFSEFNKFSNVGVHECRYGCINNGGNNSFTNCGFNSNMIAFYMNGETNKCIRYDGSTANGRNMGHGVMSNCILDHNGKDNSDVGYAIVAKSIDPGFQFSNLSIHYNKLYFSDVHYFTISGVKLGSATGIEIRNSGTAFVLTDLVGITTSFIPFAIYENDVLISDFDDDGNGGRVYMDNCFRYRTRATPQYLMSLS